MVGPVEAVSDVSHRHVITSDQSEEGWLFGRVRKRMLWNEWFEGWLSEWAIGWLVGLVVMWLNGVSLGR